MQCEMINNKTSLRMLYGDLKLLYEKNTYLTSINDIEIIC